MLIEQDHEIIDQRPGIRAETMDWERDTRLSEELEWPNFFIVGAQNSATTALYLYLRNHPGVFMPAMKEPHYFSCLEPSRNMRYPISHVSDRRAYLHLFSRARRRKMMGEASSSYLWERQSAARIREVSPHAKIVIMLRDPVARAYSHYLMDVREGWADLPFFEALQRDWQSPRKGYGISRLYVELGLYCNQVKAYLQAFGSQALHIVLFEEFTESISREDPRVIEEIFQFLELDGDGILNFRQLPAHTENGYAEARFESTRRIAGSKVARKLGQAIVPQRFGSTFMLKRRFYEPLILREGTKPPIDPRARRWLCEMFDQDLTALEKLLGRKLPSLRQAW
jgi:Sulfotransferase family